MVAVFAFDPRKTLMEVSAVQILIDNIHHMRTPITIFSLITLFPNPFKLLKISFYTLIILTFSRVPRDIRFSH